MLPLGLDFPWKRMWRRGGGVRLRGGSMRWRESLEAIAASVEDALTDGPININAISYQNLLVHIAIALVRINAGCYVPLDVRGHVRHRAPQ